MRVLLIPLGWDKPNEHVDLVNAFNVNHEAVLFEHIWQAHHYQPEVVFYQGGLSARDCKALKETTNSKWVTWTGDVRYAPLQHLQEAKEFTDVFLVPFAGELLDAYSVLLGKPCRYIWEYFPDYRLREPIEMNDGKVSFVGNVYNCVPGGESRIELSEFIKNHINSYEIHGSGNGEQIPVEQVPDLYQSSYIVIAENNWQDILGYFTPRNLQGMSASCCVMKEFPGIENHFTNWVNCVYYKHKYELLDIITYLKLNPDVRNRIAKAGYNLVKNKYSTTNWAEQFIKII